jgi:hypothetical protein
MKILAVSIINRIGKRIEQRHFSKEPVYIGGCGRSGTTLLLSILSSHSEIFACPRELNLFENSYVEKGKLVTPKMYRLYRTFITHKIPPSALRFCEKSPSNVRNIQRIDQLHHGKFKFIHIIRDGRDVVLSRHPRRTEGYWIEPERWISDVKAGLNYADDPRVHTVKYEDLVLSYKATISEICRFLEIPLSDDILHWHKHARVRQNRALFNEIGELSSGSIGKWKKKENEIRVSQFLASPESASILKKLNYL